MKRGVEFIERVGTLIVVVGYRFTNKEDCASAKHDIHTAHSLAMLEKRIEAERALMTCKSYTPDIGREKDLFVDQTTDDFIETFIERVGIQFTARNLELVSMKIGFTHISVHSRELFYCTIPINSNEDEDQYNLK